VIAERFRQAKRNGTPAWLWPDIAIEAWRAAMVRVVEITSSVLLGDRAPGVATGDPDAFGLACYTSGMGPLLGWWHEQGLFEASRDIARILDLHWRHNRTRHRRLSAIACDVAQRLEEERIAAIALKGLHTAITHFPTQGTRPMADIDLLVADADVVAAEAAFYAAGLVPGAPRRRETHWQRRNADARLRTLMFVHEDDPWVVDVHCSLDQYFAAGAPLVRFDEADPFGQAAPLPGLGGMKGLAQPLLLLHLATHAGGALHNLTLLRLVELYLVIKQDEAAGCLSWHELIETGVQIDALGYAYPALKLCEMLMPGTVPTIVLDRCAAAAPRRVVRFVVALTPATAQRVDRSSLAEHFMWTSGWGKLRQLAADLVLTPQLRRAAWSIYERRAWQLLRGRVGA
jgi:hypothetical protein